MNNRVDISITDEQLEYLNKHKTVTGNSIPSIIRGIISNDMNRADYRASKELLSNVSSHTLRGK